MKIVTVAVVAVVVVVAVVAVAVVSQKFKGIPPQRVPPVFPEACQGLLRLTKAC